MNIPFLGKWRLGRPTNGGEGLAAAFENDPDAVTGLFSECELLRSQAAAAGLELDDSAASLDALDQLLPRWRDDPELAPWLGNDAGLYLGTVIVRHVPGAAWHVWPAGQAVVRLPSGREIHVVEEGLDWAVSGSPELYRIYAEASED
ncbi:DUF6278 family protein [Streptomyces sp. TS71-3]|uniref:DUF6278 family protein n=1 Tax=Streptomyces sp. TS71-3 TaxID=2733862 RepID=UPI001B16CC5A|nr:DUF6278 family protein [Streptomyces sp. TS71-3]GHJ41281.1 hypothetical protein Sm713_68900 [Streptomyces sp. TS71-3]